MLAIAIATVDELCKSADIPGVIIPLAPSSVDEQILSIYKKGGYGDKPDIDVSYALGHMSFEDYAKANGENTLWCCSSKDEFNKCVAAARSAEADNVAPEAGTEKTNDIEADND